MRFQSVPWGLLSLTLSLIIMVQWKKLLVINLKVTILLAIFHDFPGKNHDYGVRKAFVAFFHFESFFIFSMFFPMLKR